MSENHNVLEITNYIKEKIERCIQKYMSLEQTMMYLQQNHHISHPLTRAIWDHLQRERQGFFKEYYKRCEVARQIAKFNDLLAQQIDQMQIFREIELSTITPISQLQKPNDHQLHPHHHQYQIHDQWTAYNDFAYTERTTSSLMDTSLIAAPPQSEPCTSCSRYGIDFEGLSFEQFGRDLDHQQERLQLNLERLQQPQHLTMDQQEVYNPQEHLLTTFLLPEQLSEHEVPNNIDLGKSEISDSKATKEKIIS